MSYILLCFCNLSNIYVFYFCDMSSIHLCFCDMSNIRTCFCDMSDIRLFCDMSNIRFHFCDLSSIRPCNLSNIRL